jgi:thymidylate synthase ThyX
MPKLFGAAEPTATEHTLDMMSKDPRAQTREGAKAMLEDMRRTKPNLFNELDLDKLSDYIGNLPRGTTSTRKIPPDEMRMNMSRPSFIK